MIECGRCHRHVRASDTTCPFCADRPLVPPALMNALGGALTTLVLAACYGGPDKSFTPTLTCADLGTCDSGTTADTGPTTPSETGSTGETGTP